MKYKLVYAVVTETKDRFNDLHGYSIEEIVETEASAIQWIEKHRPDAVKITSEVKYSDNTFLVPRWEEYIRDPGFRYTRVTRIKRSFMSIKEETDD